VTWPAVAGDDCYRTDSLPKAARDLLAESGISVVGDPADSAFAPSHMLDTYYHVDSTAAAIRTERLIQRLLETPGFAERSGADAYRSTAVQGAEAFRALASRYSPNGR
jgi:hypothetical protein